jgi:hypothetical protein
MTVSGSGITANTTGVHSISACVTFTPAAAFPDLQAIIYVGGSPAFQTAYSNLSSGEQVSVNVSGDFYVTSGQLIELYCYQNSGASRSNSTGSNLTWLSASFITD